MSSSGLAQLHAFHQSFNESVKLAVVAIEVAKSRSTTSPGFPDEFREAVPRATKVWGKYYPRDFGAAAAAARRDLSRNGVVGAFAAFEAYLQGLAAYADARGGIRGKRKATKVREPWKNDLAHHCVAGVGLKVPELEAQRAILAFFRELRNCVAHQEGVASDRLQRISGSVQLKTALASWPLTARARRLHRALPTLPVIRDGVTIPLEPEHAILASTVCFHLGSSIDAKLTIAYGP